MHTTVLTVLLIAGAKLGVPQSVDPSTIDIDTKTKWCNDQKASCPLLCLQLPNTTAGTQSNTCDNNNLAFTCVCSNGQSPNASQYSQTIPYYLCTQAATNCVNKCAQGDASCQSACRNDNPCGAQNPVRVNTSTISSMPSTTATGASATGSKGAGTTSTGTTNSAGRAQAVVLGVGRTYGLAAVLAAVGGAFVFIL